MLGDCRSVAHFHEHGWMRVPAAFASEAAAAMREAVWRVLAGRGIHRERPETWTEERPGHLQALKNDPAFQAVGGEPLIQAIDTVLEGAAYPMPRDWGAFFVAFPSAAQWEIPTGGWHADANYTSALRPARGVKTLALFGDVVPRGGGTQIVSGSHRLAHAWFAKHPPPPGARSAEMRRLLRIHPYIRDLHSPADTEQRVARFMDRAENANSIPLQVVELTGSAGDVYLLHPLVLHVAAPNTAATPRFLLSGGVTTDMWGWVES